MDKLPGFGDIPPRYDLEIRKRIAAAQIGETVVMPIGDLPLDQARAIAKSFGGRRRYPVIIFDAPDDRPGELCFKRVTEDEAKSFAYPELDLLQIGQSHLFAAPKPMHQRIRMAASVRNRRGDVLLSCTLETGGLRVTRHPLTEAEIAAHGFIETPKRPSKYGLEQLEHLTELRFTSMQFVETQRLRLAVSTKAKIMGWKLRCRLQNDGTMVVTREAQP
jgi:hypothetical protein